MCKYLITGATGYIGSMLIKNILASENNSEIVAIVRNREKAESIFKGSKNIKFVCLDLTKQEQYKQIEGSYDYIIHCAAITSSAEMVDHPISVIESILYPTDNILKFALKCDVKSIVYLSSMEVYGNMSQTDTLTHENDLGYIDISDVRSCYPQAKRMAENICVCYFKQYGLPVKIARLAQTFGYGVNSSDNRIFSQFAKAVLKNENIVLHTDGTSMGNYCEITDAVKGILTILKTAKTAKPTMS